MADILPYLKPTDNKKILSTAYGVIRLDPLLETLSPLAESSRLFHLQPLAPNRAITLLLALHPPLMVIKLSQLAKTVLNWATVLNCSSVTRIITRRHAIEANPFQPKNYPGGVV